MYNMHKGSESSIKKGQTLNDEDGRSYEARGRRDKRNKPQRGGGLKGIFRNKATNSQLGDVWEAA